MENKHIGCSKKIPRRDELAIKILTLKDIIRNVCIVLMYVLHE
jgi:hypothetical protein